MQWAIALLTGIVFPAGGVDAAGPLDDMSISALEERRDSIGEELERLAVFTLRTGAIGTSGYRSFPQTEPLIDDEWIRIDLKREVAIDEVVLVPTLWRYSDEKGYLSDGFPEAFRIVAGTGGNEEGEVVAEFDSSDNLLPRVAPVVVPLSGVRASWIRIEPTRLSSRARDGRYIFQLSEVLIFSGEENVALHQAVTSASDVPQNSGIWKPALVVDGGMPYLMDSAEGYEGSAHTQILVKNPVFTLDLEKEYPVSGIHLHGAYQSKSAPPEFNVNWGIPSVLTVEGASRPDFSDAVVLLKKQFQNLVQFPPILMWNTPRVSCRYIRISGGVPAEERSKPLGYVSSNRIGFAEIEILAGGRNVAAGKGPVAGAGSLEESPGLAKLTDGFNFYGDVLPLRSWVHQLARRHDLEAELAQVNVQLEARYGKQQALLSLLKRLTIALVVLIAATVLIGWYLRKREAARLRERFTADLHDHVGASLHAIGILGSHTKDILDSPEKLVRTLDQIELMTARASEATRDFCNQQMAKEAHENLLADLRRTASRMIANLSYTFEVEGEEYLQQLKPRMRSDFFLFFKECLINVNRHADATEVTIQLVADSRSIRLSISDNGRGLADGERGRVPPSLARRARFLRSRVIIETPPSGGSRISLRLKTRRVGLPALAGKKG